ncbi:hypothetical protein B0H17DRAFT_1206545 [Mycena rosella]|uniref:Uncharacterized protein n=1 Tax=Mycena rosella TaxID=1033263 RepID=A0AAD7D4N8_MYCRO|nr:hypothetical protein B0H17DRAFT_1206545 [Mycena rosella]
MSGERDAAPAPTLAAGRPGQSRSTETAISSPRLPPLRYYGAGRPTPQQNATSPAQSEASARTKPPRAHARRRSAAIAPADPLHNAQNTSWAIWRRSPLAHQGARSRTRLPSPSQPQNARLASPCTRLFARTAPQQLDDHTPPQPRRSLRPHARRTATPRLRLASPCTHTSAQRRASSRAAPRPHRAPASP